MGLTMAWTKVLLLNADSNSTRRVVQRTQRRSAEMLSCIRRPTITYDLPALAENSYVSVGRETDAHIQLDSQDIPCLLSRKHAHLMLQPGGSFTLVDLGSTNGTFAARQSQPLRKLPPGYAWELQHGDTVGFGGPETIIVKRSQVGNPFLFKYYTPTGWALEQPTAQAPNLSAVLLLPASGASAAQRVLPDRQQQVPADDGGAAPTSASGTARPPAPARDSGRDTVLQSIPLQQLLPNNNNNSSSNQQQPQGGQQGEDEVMKDGADASPRRRHDAPLSRHATAAAPLPPDAAAAAHHRHLSADLAQHQPALAYCSPAAHGGHPPHGGRHAPPGREAHFAGGKENAPGAHGGHPAQAAGPPGRAAANPAAGGMHPTHPQGAHAHLPPETATSGGCGGGACGALAVVVTTPRSSHQRQAQLAERVHTHLTCPVCCDLLISTHMLHCGHMFCGLCLATWMTQNQSCPSCRKPITGVPVRCFTIDNMISELMVHGGGGGSAALAPHHMSPSTRVERLRKQEHWDNIQRHIVQDWVTALQRRRDAAMQEAARHNQELQQAGAGGGPVQLPVVPPQQLLQPVPAPAVEVVGAAAMDMMQDA